jgi:DNA-binding transcriptional LysR family regulator
MTLQQLNYFLAVAEERSFSRAAGTLHLTQQSLSEQIKRLESELGVPLFVRAGRRLELTEAGRLFRPEAERTIAAAEEAREVVRELRTLEGGSVSFGTFGSAHHYLLTGLVRDFRRRHPHVRVRVVGQNSSEVADAVRDGRLEAGLIVLPIDDRGLEVRALEFREEIMYMSADPERVTAPKTVEELAQAPLILYDARWGTGDPTRRQLAERAQRAGVTMEAEIEVEYLTAALDLASRGVGDTLAPAAVARTRGYRQLKWVSLDPPLYDTFAFVTRRNAHLSPATRAFMALAEDHIEKLAARLKAEDREEG